ncbi:hypothetical protein OI450_12140 [Pectobacterium cacticida]|uniref:Uncharacterized protein n=1 Tax=Pectobacterium cacticida TaxID=69221 RepID=A0ABZ2GE87_9GAMM|nr:hypothetical protein [Pectobacterium cacticida]UYX05718.1 hypothetical protein OI450_12140 [Pectobacterium cacticida]
MSRYAGIDAFLAMKEIGWRFDASLHLRSINDGFHPTSRLPISGLGKANGKYT